MESILNDVGLAGPPRSATPVTRQEVWRSPLSIDLRARTNHLLQQAGFECRPISPSIDIPNVIWDVAFPNCTRSTTLVPRLLDALSSLLASPGYSDLVLISFNEILLDLLARWLERTDGIQLEEWERRLGVVASLAEIRPDLWSLVVAFLGVSPFGSSPLSAIPAEDLPSTPAPRLHTLLLVYLRLITADPLIAFRNDWPLSLLHTLRTQHDDRGVRLLAIQILGKQRGWSEVKRMQMEREWVGPVDEVPAEVCYSFEVVKLSLGGSEISGVMVSGWMIPILEARRAAKYAAGLSRLHEAAASLSPLPLLVLEESQLSPRTTLIADTLLIRDSIPDQAALIDFLHVPTLATTSTLQEIIPKLQLGLPVLLTSLPSSGKTHILKYLSSQLFPARQSTSHILTIPLADTTIDVKSLVGTYVSSPTKPGTFEWMEGALAKAVRAGRWVIFDDIDRASLEMLVTVAGLARSLKRGRAGRRAILAVPGREGIEAGNGFAMFATRNSRADSFTPPTFFGHHNCTEVVLDTPSDLDILTILSERFRNLHRSVTEILVDIWKELRPLARTGGQVKDRDIGLRDLEKWCARVQRNLPPPTTLSALEQAGTGPFANPVFQDEVFLEAADVFSAALDTKANSREKKAQIVATITRYIGMDPEGANSLLVLRKPQLELSSSSETLRIGRTCLLLAPSERRAFPPSGRPFALTKPSLVLLEQIAATASMNEPTLLVGETGTGKTTAVQYIANSCRKPLSVLNLSTQTESSDLLGGYKPIDASVSARSLQARWQKLFCDTFSMAKQQNTTFLDIMFKALSGRKWSRCADLWAQSARRAVEKLTKHDPAVTLQMGSRKRRRITDSKVFKAALQWQALLVDIADFDLHHVKMKSRLVFSFVEGPLVKALKSGEWLLLDEVNLASQETLEAISTLLEGSAASLVLTERGDLESIPRHPDFRLFACMNPATDVGKKDLPPNLRARFTEIYVPPPDDDRDALITIVAQYLGDATAGDKGVILDVVEMYTTLKSLSLNKEIVDGSNIAPHYSMRTLARALTFAIETAPLFGLRRGLWEGCLMAFTMSLDAPSAKRAHEVCELHLLGPMRNARAVLSQVPSLPASADSDRFVRFGSYWLRRGPMATATESRYVTTPSVQAKLADLARVILTHRYPVLIQGPTSSGKTSAVEFLARQTGHRFVRINNHEHTDIQEYLGTYVTDPQTGNLVFQEGLLVTAVRQGHWIVLDELNLAPTDVLEALNRLLDDNHELVIPETQEVITPHPNFILFATQNPPGLYAGRKVLSRAFRNRFLEVHFDDVPKDELETILCQRCQIAPSYAKRIVQVFEELRHRRQASRVFESKQSFATLRDLFRWAERAAVGYQQLAEDGYMLIGERARQADDKLVIKQVIEEIMKVTIVERRLYQLFDSPSDGITSRLPFKTVPSSTTVWTRAMRRLFGLVAFALARNEPVLLVGETGCGKTSVCEVLAEAFSQRLVGVNCHQNMETADFLGSQRPVRNRNERRARIVARLSEITMIPEEASDDDLNATCEDLLHSAGTDYEAIVACQREIKQLSALFEWSDGPLVNAMRTGDLLLLDEVSLADDSVLERLNSVLEPGRTLVLAEKGGIDIDEASVIANPRFHVVATMNPGGDFGKKELSPALRNRFTEIWVPPLDDRDDLLQIVEQSWKYEGLKICGPLILDFFEWFAKRTTGNESSTGLRDVLAWVNFINHMYGRAGLDLPHVFRHGGEMVVIDGLESLPHIASLSVQSISLIRSDCLKYLSELASSISSDGNFQVMSPDLKVQTSVEDVAVGGFAIQRGSFLAKSTSFRFDAPTTALNVMRVLRACQLPKAILLEGSPGVGKTSLVGALASLSGRHLRRINLSDQTDLIDLFGSDLPVDGGQAGEFQWRDAAFLDAMQSGDWVLLDEMNLASQTVLEGLNAALDHRGTVSIPELGRSFFRHPDFRVFAAQNPLQQGGGRKGLPMSFLNRFTKVYLQEFTPDDFMLICRGLHPMPDDAVQQMIAFNEALRDVTMRSKSVGQEGSPWEFNLRDLFRWFHLLATTNGLEISTHPIEHFGLVYGQRFRNARDREAVLRIFQDIFDHEVHRIRPTPFITPEWLQIGHSLVRRTGSATIDPSIHPEHLDVSESVLKCIEMGWLVILAGENASGKRRLIRSIASCAGRTLGEFSMHPGVDTSEILGSFEQQDIRRLLKVAYNAIGRLVDDVSEDDPAFSHHSAALHDAFVAIRLGDSAALAGFIALGLKIVRQSPIHFDKLAASTALGSLRVAGPNAAGFTWVDGELLHAIRNGGWFLISDANFCNPSILDRLNSLCESKGVLVMSEKGSSTGSPETIKPHPDFRLFMTYDPRHGELSRAMRNRGVEIFVDRPKVDQSTASPALADQSISRALVMLDSSWNSNRAACSTAPVASLVANTVALQLPSALPFLQNLESQLGAHGADLYPTIVALVNDVTFQAAVIARHTAALGNQFLPDNYGSALQLDASLNPHIRNTNPDQVFRTLQLFLRNHARCRELQEWTASPANSKSVLAVSAASVHRGASRTKPSVGSLVYPFVDLLRDLLHNRLAVIIDLKGVDEAKAADLDHIELIHVHLRLLEEHAMSDTFDYSSTQLLAGWLRSALQRYPLLSLAQDRLENLSQEVRITTGLGQSRIWAMFRDGATHGLRELIPHHVLQSLEEVQDPELRRLLLQALVLRSTSFTEIPPEDELSALLKGELLLPSPQQQSSDAGRWANWSTLAAIELYLLSHAFKGSEDEEAMSLLVHEPQYVLSELFDMSSIASTQTPKPAVRFRTMCGWLQRMWDHEGFEVQGPGNLFAATQLASVLRFGTTKAVKMAEIPQEQAALQFTIDSALWRLKRNCDRRHESLSLALASVTMILAAFGLNVAFSTDAGQLLDQLQNISLATCHQEELRRTCIAHLSHPLSRMICSPDDLSELGHVWLGVAKLILDLYVTNIPIDPAVRRLLMGKTKATHLSLLHEELAAVEAGEIALKGISGSDRVDRLRDRLQKGYDESVALGPTLDRPSDPARLALLFSEVHNFMSEAVGDDKLDQLVNAITSNFAQALQRENAFQLAAAAFVQRLLINYDDLSDLVQPIVTALSYAQFGVRCLARDMQLRHASTTSLLPVMVTFPVVAGIDDLMKLAEERGTDTNFQLLEAAASWYTLGLDGDMSSRLPVFVSHLDGLYATWSDARSREQREAQDAESLYRIRRTNIAVLSEEEQESKELAELFPQYDETSAGDDEPPSPSEGQLQITADFGSKQVEDFHRLVVDFPGSGRTGDNGLLRRRLDAGIQSSFDLVSTDEKLDNRSLSFQIRQLHLRRAATQTLPMPANFYLEPNEPEIRKAHTLITRLRSRLDILILDWPEQMVLQHIRDRCERVLNLDTKQPVAMILSVLEQLLQHTNDWESYANRDNSLQAFQHDASVLIIEWRKLELSSWMRLLDDQAGQYVARDAEWTLRLYGALIRGGKAADDIDKHLSSVLPMVTTYLNTSTVGVFDSRLMVLSCLERLALGLSRTTDGEARKLTLIWTVLHNVLANAQLFGDKVRETLQTQRAIIDRSIKDYVKLASWKDVNVYALKVSALKSHRHLHRSIRKFRDLLQQPIAPILVDLLSICQQDPPQMMDPISHFLVLPLVRMEAFHSRPEEDRLPDHLIRLDDTFGKYHDILVASDSVSLTSSGSHLDAMAVDIIETAAGLAKSTPANLTKENAKIVKNLASRKRKAFSDLLKALRACGFSQSVRSDLLAHQQSAPWLAARPVLPALQLTDVCDTESVRKIDSYHHRQAILMTALRTAFNGHNPDIASQDLRRGIGYTESIVAVALAERDHLVTQIQMILRLNHVVQRLKRCSTATSVFGGSEVVDQVSKAEHACRYILDGLREGQEGVRQLRDLQGSPVTALDLSVIQAFSGDFSSLVEALSSVTTAVQESSCRVLTIDEVELLSRFNDTRSRLVIDLQYQSRTTPEFRHLLLPLVDLARSKGFESAKGSNIQVSGALWRQSDDLIQALLVMAQGVQSIPNPIGKPEGDSVPHIPSDLARQRGHLLSLHIADVTNQTVSLVESLANELISDGSSTLAPLCIARVLPFVESAFQAFVRHTTVYAYTVKSTYKLSYVVGRVMVDLAQKGFCKPSEESDSGKDGQEGEAAEGTGMGIGTGDKNVSSEIEEEGQIEGQQGEEQEDETEGAEKDEDDAVSMDADFEGALGEGKEKDEQDATSEGDDEEEHDEHVGDVDPLDPGAVDEKFWGDEDKQDAEADGKEDVTNEKTPQTGGQAEVSAKENERNESKREDEDKQDDHENQEQDAQHNDTDDAFTSDDDEMMPNDNEGDQQQEGQDQSEVAIPEGDRLDLPEDLDFDANGDDEEGKDGDDEMVVSEGEEKEGSEHEDANSAIDDDGDVMDDAPPATGVTEEESEALEETVNQKLDLSASNEAQPSDPSKFGQGTGGLEAQQVQSIQYETQEGDPPDDEERIAPPGEGSAQQSQGGPTGEQHDCEGVPDSSGAQAPADPQGQPQASRSLGDIMQDIRRRRDEILAQEERTEPAQRDPNAEDEAPGQVEYLRDEEMDDDVQALGPASEEERQKLADLRIVDDEAEGNPEGPDGFRDDEEPITKRPAPNKSEAMDNIVEERTPSTAEQALTRADVGGQRRDPAFVTSPLDGEGEGTEQAEDMKPDVMEEDIHLEMVDQDTSVGQSNGEEVWRRYSSLTSDLSYALCEQLRLILEPTLATRLQGDFRTGKRLNMRKIIPYIASEYNKDKIWLRRTKPSRREYQVLLSLDDSRSMAESHSVHLAYQTLALVSQALNKLEVGQISIARFGESVDILHPFGDTGFTDVDGAKVMSAFRFDQHRTDVAALVERTLTFLSEARQRQTSSSSAPDLWQLQIIISDGVCQDHHRLRTLLRRALEERVMIVFIVVDSLHQSTSTGAAMGTASTRPSILSMQTVEYKNVNGEMQLEMQRYLDTFPFEFYVVLRDVEALPGVLADTLRQWMARVSQSQE